MTGPQRHPKRAPAPWTRTHLILGDIPTDPERAVTAAQVALAVGHYPNLARRLQRLTEEGRIIRTTHDGINRYHRPT